MQVPNPQENPMKKIVIAAALATFVSGSFAAAETYAIDPAHTAPRFEYSHFGFSNQLHRFDKTSGKIVIDAKSVNTGFPVFNEHIQGDDFFATAAHPTITFKSTAVKFEGDKPVTVDGNLTIKGVTRPVTLTVTTFQAMPHPMLKKDAIGANAVTKIKRSDFNMGKYAPYVSDDVTLSIGVEAIKE